MNTISPRDISICDYNYPLPDERIARHPLAERDSCKLLVRDAAGVVSDHIFSELPSLLPSDSMLVYNNTRVINARLHFRKPSGALIEIFCLEPWLPADYEQCFASCSECVWKCLVGNSKRWKEGPLVQTVGLPDGRSIELVAHRDGFFGNASLVRFSWDASGGVTFSEIISALGEIPIPPYLNRESEESDSTDYQTVYSHIEGSVAAPTAGLHFTPAVLDAVDRAGIPRREVTLHVGAGTFQPVKAGHIGDHDMHSEFITADIDFIAELASTARSVVAVGTTSVRTLESLYHIGCMIHAGEWDGELPQWYPYSPTHPGLSVSEALMAVVGYLRDTGDSVLMARTKIIIAPGYTYRIVRGMITNFHQPQSTLLLLVSAFIGDSWRQLYDHALASGYRFLSYGDACLFLC